MRASSPNIRLNEADAAIVKAMIVRGDRDSDIASWFGVNQGRIAEINTGQEFVLVKPFEGDLPPPGPYVVKDILQRCMELEELLKLRYELEGVLSDYENDNRIGDIGYNTIKRVAQALSRAEEGEGC